MHYDEIMCICQTKINELETTIKKIKPRMNEFTPDYQINIKYKILESKLELYQIYTESKMNVMVGHSLAGNPMLDEEFCISKISKFIDELNNL